MSVPALPAPKVSVLLNSLVIAAPSAAVPSCVCPEEALKAAKSWSNSSLESDASIISPSVYVDCRI